MTDVHGSDVCFRKFLNAAKFYKANVLILGGDITGKSMVPIIQTGTETYECSFAGEFFVIKSEEKLDSIVKDMRDSGVYPKVMGKKEYDELNSNPEKLGKFSISSWSKE